MLVKEKSERHRVKEDESQASKTRRKDSKADQWHQFRRQFPHLSTELEVSQSRVRIDGVRWEEAECAPVETSSSRGIFASYSPDPIDFIRRCKTKEQAFEIIAFLEERKEIDAIHAESLRHQLQTRGLQSFGPRKTPGHYDREG